MKKLLSVVLEVAILGVVLLSTGCSGGGGGGGGNPAGSTGVPTTTDGTVSHTETPGTPGYTAAGNLAGQNSNIAKGTGPQMGGPNVPGTVDAPPEM